MLDNEGQEMLDREVVVAALISTNSSQPGPSNNTKMDVVFQDAVKMSSTHSFSQLSGGGSSSSNEKKPNDADDDICIIEKISELALEEQIPTGIIVGVDPILSRSPTKAVVSALAAVFSLPAEGGGGGMMILSDQEQIGDIVTVADDALKEGVGVDTDENCKAATGAIWRDSGGNRDGKEGSDTLSEYLDAC